MSKLKDLLAEVRYLKGEVMNDPQTWSETHVSGGGGFNTGVKITSEVDTWTTFLIETENGKEFMVKWPESLSVRKGHQVKVAVFRGNTIAFINERTDTRRLFPKIESVDSNDLKLLPSIISYGGLICVLYFAYQGGVWLTNDEPSAGTGTTIFITCMLTVITVLPFALIKNFKTKRLQRDIPRKAFNILQNK